MKRFGIGMPVVAIILAVATGCTSTSEDSTGNSVESNAVNEPSSDENTAPVALNADSAPVVLLGTESGPIVLEAESADATATIIDTKHAGYTGEGFRDFKPNAPGGTLKWQLELSEGGEYTMQVRYAHAEGNRPLKIEINNEVVAESMEFMGTGAWTNWQTRDLPVSLNTGINEIILTAVGNAGGGNIDHVKLIPRFSAVYEAEDGVATATIIDTKHAGYTGAGFRDFKPNAPGGTIEWEVEVPFDGEYTLQFRYAHASGNRPLQVSVNGDVTVESLEFQGTGAWTNWQTVEANAQLKEGSNIITVTAIGSEGGGNLDHLKILAGGRQTTDRIAYRLVAIQDLLTPQTIDSLERRGLLQRGANNDRLKMQGGAPRIIDAYSLSGDLMYIRIDSGYPDYKPDDLAIAAARGSWAALDPALTYLPIESAAVGADPDGNTVVVFRLEDPYEPAGNEPQKFSGDVTAGLEQARNLISWQMDNGSWTKSKDDDYRRSWNGTEPKTDFFGIDGQELGTIDNDATVKEIRFLSQIYRETDEQDLKDSVIGGLDFLLGMQSTSGGFPQMYPQRDVPGGDTYYSNYATFNDDAMINVLELFDDILEGQYPFDGDLVEDELLPVIEESRSRGIDFILKSQIRVDGRLTAWCAQHDAISYEPMPARSYEHVSISGKESVSIVKYLLSIDSPSEDIREAIDGAITWFQEVKLEGITYVPRDPKGEYFVDDPQGATWYRFYDINGFEPIFSGRDGVIKRRILDIEEERRNGYSWAGPYAERLLEIMDSIGYFPGKVYIQVVGDESRSAYDADCMAVGEIVEITNLE